MDLWPGTSKVPKRDTSSKKKKGKGRSIENGNWTNYPLINHGALSAATLLTVGDSLEWRTVHSSCKGSLTTHGEPTKIYPMTRPKDIRVQGISFRQRAQQGARFLRTYHPDIDIPFELIKEELDLDDKFVEERAAFDPFKGNTISATYCHEGPKKRSIAIAFPTGGLNRDLNISPANLRQTGLLFQPRTQPLWSFDTPIRQIASSAPAVSLTQKKGCYLAVRTYGQISVFDIRNQIVFASSQSRSPYAISELMTIHSPDLEGGQVMDVDFSACLLADLFVVTRQGAGYQCSLRDERKVIKRVFDQPSESSENGGFWRIYGDSTAYGCIVTSERLVRKFDTRFSAKCTDLLSYDEGRQVVTSICPADIDHLYCVSTTSQVIWIDERFSKQPLLGWKHHRAFDRTLNVQAIGFDGTSVCLLSSRRNNHVSAISVGKLDNGPLQCQMSSCAVTPATPDCAVVGRTLIRHPSASSSSFSLIELSEQGSLHHLDLHYSNDVGTSDQESAPSEFNFQWSDEVMELDRTAKDLRPDAGNLSSSERALADLSEIYEALFGEEASQLRADAEEKGAEDVYETLEKMPLFWQRSDHDEEHLRTLFDVIFGSGEEPLHEARSDFLTGSVLNSARGYRARKHGRIPVDEVTKKAAWHTNIQETMHRISPDVFRKMPVPAEALGPYYVSRDEEMPKADRRESEAREQLALDLALSTDVYSATTFKPQVVPTGTGGSEAQEAAAFLTQAAEQLSLTQKEPPAVTFGYLRPLVRDRKKYYKESGGAAASASRERDTQSAAAEEEEEGEEEKEAEMPLGVRLLLSEWNVRDDPYAFEYVDPYDLEGGQRLPRTQTQSSSSEDDVGGTLRHMQNQAPPTVITAKSLAPKSTQPRPVGGFSQPSMAQHSAARPHAQTQTQLPHGCMQTETGPTSSQPMAIANTQVLSGPFGGRQAPGTKKLLKKRLGGF